MSTVTARRTNSRSIDSASPIPDRSEAHDFAGRFCARYQVSREAYRTAVLQRGLYPLARLLAPLLRLCDSDFFAADLDFVEGVGRLTSRRDFGTEADEFTHHPANRGMLRQTLRLRLSIARMRDLVNDIFGDSTNPPFARGGGGSNPPL